jgi:hypothetical protein
MNNKEFLVFFFFDYVINISQMNEGWECNCIRQKRLRSKIFINIKRRNNNFTLSPVTPITSIKRNRTENGWKLFDSSNSWMSHRSDKATMVCMCSIILGAWSNRISFSRKDCTVYYYNTKGKEKNTWYEKNQWWIIDTPLIFFI